MWEIFDQIEGEIRSTMIALVTSGIARGLAKKSKLNPPAPSSKLKRPELKLAK